VGLVKSNPAGGGEGPRAEAGSLAALLAALAASDASERRAAARALADHPAAAAALCDQLEAERAPSVRAMILTSLIRMASPAVAGRLAALLRSEDAALRNGAIEALREMPEAIGPHVDALLADPDDDVRLFAVNILSEVSHVQAPDWLVGVIRHEPHPNVCAAAVDGLAEIGTLAAIPDLEALRDRFPGDAFMAFAINTAIHRIRGA